jgi:hypothetical protein
MFLLLFSYVILCDFFPLYDYPVDICAPSKDLTEKEDSQGNSTKVSYGFQRHARPSVAELVLVVWVFTLFCEEIRQVISFNT